MMASSTAKAMFGDSGLAQLTSVIPVKKYSSRQKSVTTTSLGMWPIHRGRRWCLREPRAVSSSIWARWAASADRRSATVLRPPSG